MNDIHLLCISDIHFNKRSAVNQDTVIRAFFKDLPNVIGRYDKDSLYCVISGDLVYAANMQMMYDEFYNEFIKRLQKFVALDHIICTPGNHDLNRNIFNAEDWVNRQNALIDCDADEETCNAQLKDEKDFPANVNFRIPA